MNTCPCGFAPHATDEDGNPIAAHGVEWSERHRAHHLATFPAVDERTRRNLDDLVAWAQHVAEAV